jgi:hypothetical protein
MGIVSELSHLRMSVVDFEELLFDHVREIFGRDRPSEIRVVEVHEDLAIFRSCLLDRLPHVVRGWRRGRSGRQPVGSVSSRLVAFM